MRVASPPSVYMQNKKANKQCSLVYMHCNFLHKVWFGHHSRVLQPSIDCKPWRHYTYLWTEHTWSPAWPSSTALRADLSTLIAVGLFLRISRLHLIVSCSNLSSWKKRKTRKVTARGKEGKQEDSSELGILLRTWGTLQTNSLVQQCSQVPFSLPPQQCKTLLKTTFHVLF